MKIVAAFFALPLVAISIAFPNGSVADAAEIKVMSSVGYSGAVSELARRFEGATGHKVALEFSVVAVLKRRIDAGEVFDVAILSPALIEELIQIGKIAADTRVTIGRIGMGLAARKGGPRPDIGSPEALRRALLGARSVGYSTEGGSGKVFIALLERMGIAAEMKPRIKAVGVPTIKAVIDGETEFVFTSVTLILTDPAVELVGRLPAELQSYTVPTAGASTGANEAGRAFIRFLTSRDAAPVLEAYGVESDARKVSLGASSFGAYLHSQSGRLK
jgi:molybdate transport system substrate-binding protein